jgi:glycosyltransferase involved in cell wall biosynthesis
MGSTPARRILILCKYFSYGFGGTPEAVLLLARGLARNGITTDVEAHDRFIADAGALGDLPPLRPPVIGAQRPDLAHYDGVIIAGAWIFGALPLALAARRAGLPVFYATKGQLCRVEFRRPRDLRRLIYLALVEIWVVLLADRILFTSELEKAATILPRRMKDRKGLVVPEPVDRDRLGHAARAARVPGAPLRLGFIAQISPRKGLAELVEGFLRFTETNPASRMELVVAGTAVGASEAYLAAIRARIDAHAGGERIRFAGQLSGEVRARFYAGMDAIAVPSQFESFCLSVPEALASGCAVLAAPSLGVLEFLKDHPAILPIPDLSPAAISGALEAFDRAGRNDGPADAALPETLSGGAVAARIAGALFAGRP